MRCGESTRRLPVPSRRSGEPEGGFPRYSTWRDTEEEKAENLTTDVRITLFDKGRKCWCVTVIFAK